MRPLIPIHQCSQFLALYAELHVESWHSHTIFVWLANAKILLEAQ